MRRWIYWDAPLIAFVVVMLSAATITSHGTYVFYSYILPPALAVAATIVLTTGIPLLELAAVVQKDKRRRYVAGLVFLLFLESLGQYYQGQADFQSRVLAQFTEGSGIDLATFAQQSYGRVLVVLYLAALSGVVVFFGYAASARIRDLRAQAASAVAEASELARANATIHERDTIIAQREATIRDREAMISDLHTQLADQDATAQATIYELRAAIGDLHDQLAAASAPATQQPPQFAAVLRYMSEQIALGRSIAVIAAATGFSESTIRGWLPRIRADHNGHVEEVT